MAKASRPRMGPHDPPPEGSIAIFFGANPPTRQVLMEFQNDGHRIVFSSDAARDVAQKILHYADVADGRKVM